MGLVRACRPPPPRHGPARGMGLHVGLHRSVPVPAPAPDRGRGRAAEAARGRGRRGLGRTSVLARAPERRRDHAPDHGRVRRPRPDLGGRPGLGGGDEEVVGPGHLKILSTPDGGAYVNVDTTTPGGLERARELDLLGSGLADVVSTPLPAEAARSLFCGGGTHGPSPYRGRMFVMLRDPATRAWSYFRQASDPASGPGRYDPALRGATLQQYAAWELDRPEFNWMTKTLAQRPGLTTADLTTADLNLAKEVLRRKAVVGLLEQKADTLLRMEGYFGWQYGAGDGAAEDRACTDRVLHWEWKNKNRNRSAEGGEGRRTPPPSTPPWPRGASCTPG